MDEVEEVVADDSHQTDGLNLIAVMARSQETLDTKFNRSGSNRAQSWAEEVEDELKLSLDNQQIPRSAKQIWETFTKEKALEEEKSWNSAVICKVLGANPPVTIFEGFVKRIWGHLGVTQNVEYEWLPAKCAQCSKFGHTKANCRHEEIVKQKAEKTATQARDEQTTTEERIKGKGSKQGSTVMGGSEENSTSCNNQSTWKSEEEG
ncbi:hypothetical protein G4B88_000166 [Cannabis sativa]|uniref:DUF4283 domain-containing protein n=1 Tax=Cannabis sativa TaxID=3483 RepID=A0A7J6GKL7_CANSA|nr:hypothetical protein G4B88_000166 [Cannabis sativa]